MSELVAQEITAAYGAASVLRNVSIHAATGTITCILGANGAGKTTLVRSILGLMPLRSGSVRLDTTDLTSMPPNARVALGLACAPEGRKIFPKMTVEENLRVGAYLAPSDKVRLRLESVYIRFPRLKERRLQLAGTMSGGEQAMVSIGRAMMAAPKVLLVDEPSLGLSPALVKQSFEVIRRINESGITVLLIEQNVRQTLAIADYGYVLAQGAVVAQGPPDVLQQNREVQRAYFGKA